jgi:hypothetical protein
MVPTPTNVCCARHMTNPDTQPVTFLLNSIVVLKRMVPYDCVIEQWIPVDFFLHVEEKEFFVWGVYSILIKHKPFAPQWALNFMMYRVLAI